MRSDTIAAIDAGTGLGTLSLRLGLESAPTAAELIASGRSIPQVNEALGSDFLVYQEVADLQQAIIGGTDIQGLDMSCFTGDYVTGTVTEEYLEWVEKTQLS